LLQIAIEEIDVVHVGDACAENVGGIIGAGDGGFHDDRASSWIDARAAEFRDFVGDLILSVKKDGAEIQGAGCGNGRGAPVQRIDAKAAALAKGEFVASGSSVL